MDLSTTSLNMETGPSHGSDKSSDEVPCDDHTTREDFTIATILMVAYLTEAIVQILLIVNCYRSSYISLTSNWLWILLASWLISSLLVTVLSIIWTLRGMDFSGRLCGQLLCYLMHILLLGLLWRYLKIALAYDKTDVDEFFKLRTLQIYVQAFPLVVIHLVCLITPLQGFDSFITWIVAGEVISAIISLILPSLIKPKINTHHPCGNCDHDNNWKGFMSIEVNICSRILLLISRIVATGLMIFLLKYWSILVIFGHLVVTHIWGIMLDNFFGSSKSHNSFRETGDMKCFGVGMSHERKADGDGPSSFSFCMTSLARTYMLFWDVNLSIFGSIHLRSLSVPVFLVLVENVTVVLFHLHCQTLVFYTVLSGTCLICGLLLLLIIPTWKKLPMHFIHLLNQRDTSQSEESYLQSQGLPVVDHSTYGGKYVGVESNETATDASAIMLNNEQMSIASPSLNLCFYKNYKNGNSEVDFGGVHSSVLQQSTVVTNNYERIDETLMMTVNKMSTGVTNFDCLKTNAGRVGSLTPPQDSETLAKSNENTWGSSSSRNTYTISEPPPNNQSYLQEKSTNPIPKADISTMSHRLRRELVKIEEYEKSPKSLSPEGPKKVYEVHHRSPLQIRKASTKLLSSPKDNLIGRSAQNVGRCLNPGDDQCFRASDNNIYEKLIEDAYGILICEGEPTQSRMERCAEHNRPHSTPIFHYGKKLKVLCAKCLQNHDPLLTDCIAKTFTQPNSYHSQNNQKSSLYIPYSSFQYPRATSDTTEYPTDTEFTCNAHDEEEGDQLSISTHLSTAQSVTYANLPVRYNFSHFITPAKVISTTASNKESCKEFTSLEYVKAWLMMNDLRLPDEVHPSFSPFLFDKCKPQSQQGVFCRKALKGASGRDNCLRPRPKSAQSRNEVRSGITKHSGKVPVFYMKKFQPPPKQKQHPSQVSNLKTPSTSQYKDATTRNSNLLFSQKLERYLKETSPDGARRELKSELLETVV